MNTEWNIEFYQKENGEIPVEDFINSLSAKHQARALKTIELLENNGILLREPHTKHIEGEDYKGMWELRIQCANDISRIFYFLPKGNTFILLHGFVKKTQKTPVGDLKIAKKYMEDYLRRCNS